MKRKSWWNRRTATMRATIVAGCFALIGTVGAIGVPVLTSKPAPPKSADLTFVDIAVSEHLPDFPDLEHPAIVITLLNRGEARGIVTAARVHIDEALTLHACHSAGAIAVSAVYGLALPLDAAAGEDYFVKTSQELGPDEADSFAFGVQIAEEHPPPLMVFFRLTVFLTINGKEEELDTGTAIVVLPHARNDPWFFADDKTKGALDDLESNRSSWTPDDLTRVGNCLYSQSATAEAFLSGAGVRSPEVEALRSTLRLAP
ncbi:hypothetical protein AB0I28_37875 [Phytomonospora sp. NPDC050363]|uniref:hypothetical protein n=1 Tax=Phytomonospora sp. NPDC050363 TaxID=3155642 RepID=UPI0033C89471